MIIEKWPGGRQRGQGGVREGRENTVKEKGYLSTSGVQKRSCFALTRHASLCITDLQKEKKKKTQNCDLDENSGSGISFFRLTVVIDH